MQKANYKDRIIGIVGILISIILIIRFSDFVVFIINFSEKYFSPDNHIDPITVFEIEAIIAINILFIITLSVLFILNLTGNILLFFNTFIKTNKVIKFLITDKICLNKSLPLYILVIGTVLGFFLHLYLLKFGSPSHEGVMERYSSLLFLFSAIILIISMTRVNEMSFSSETRKYLLLSLTVIFGIFLLIFGEEISWGQRIFGWNSFGIFKEYNVQNETNIHNFSNSSHNYLYPFVGMSSFIVLFFNWVIPKKRKTYLFNLLLPHPSLFFLVFIMACSSFYGHSEIFEELLAIFVLLYSFRVFMCIRSPKMDLYYQE